MADRIKREIEELREAVRALDTALSYVIRVAEFLHARRYDVAADLADLATFWLRRANEHLAAAAEGEAL